MSNHSTHKTSRIDLHFVGTSCGAYDSKEKTKTNNVLHIQYRIYKRENISSSPEEKKLKDKRKNRKLEKIKALKEIPITDD